MWSLKSNSGAFFVVFLLAQEGEPLLFHIHRDDHKQTKHHQQKESNHAHRIARTPKSVLYRELSNAKQLCKPDFGSQPAECIV